MGNGSHVYPTGPASVQERRLSKADLEGLLGRLETRDVVNGTTLYVGPGRFQDCLQRLSNGDGDWPERLSGLPPGVEKSETGSVIFWSEDSRTIILPPFPVERDQLLEGWDASQLRALLARDYLLGVVLLRLGRFAVGVFRGQALLTSKTDTRYVKGRHSAGGQSQKRFERIREKQIQEIFDKTCSVVKERFAPYEDQLDYILLGGERFTLQGFLKRCDYLQRLSPRILGRTLNVREPKRDALEGTIGTIWESRVLTITCRDR